MTADPISQFFANLAAPGHLATFEGHSATLRFDVHDGGQVQHWYVVVNDGDVAVTHQDAVTRQNKGADAVIHVDRAPFEAIVTGRMNAMAALLRGVLTCEGSMAALMMFQRCLPGPPDSTGRVAPIGSQTVMAQRRPM
jgi:alkyl sulfatase BDS1-like metallo-beta-lactamase superfamily hydrolase